MLQPTGYQEPQNASSGEPLKECDCICFNCQCRCGSEAAENEFDCTDVAAGSLGFLSMMFEVS